MAAASDVLPSVRVRVRVRVRAFFLMGRLRSLAFSLAVWNEKAPSKWPHKMSKTAPLFFAASPSRSLRA